MQVATSPGGMQEYYCAGELYSPLAGGDTAERVPAFGAWHGPDSDLPGEVELHLPSRMAHMRSKCSPDDSGNLRAVSVRATCAALPLP